ncbi:unnamed protein product [Vitrella brassicaformis CCMP3155]|uniref:Translation initiation factor IF-1, chloroplastic n=2 Tax=Vitrella brassicaformis TaxID=1169539 RepID=A0A0G4EGM4_VITBC|nr:unnamed protein product [Vitrella brassicaformis CCMP3155]|eukprot:CEL94640.1 unnamed protein product [Vitrella brassicaformis CCMP3155]
MHPAGPSLQSFQVQRHRRCSLSGDDPSSSRSFSLHPPPLWRLPSSVAHTTALGAKVRRQKQQKTTEKKKDRDDRLEIDGSVAECLPGGQFLVELDGTGQKVVCTIAGKMRINRIKILLGDRVTVEMTPYDLTKGRISFRYRKGQIKREAEEGEEEGGEEGEAGRPNE